jgi:hypothetical protein
MENLTQEQLAEIGAKEVARRNKQHAYDAKYNGRIKWANEQYKAFALENGFELPEIPAEFK